jgi:flavin reductase (DIM6/NTAB) family NADH-FMN oxidoreductase RutF
MEDRQLRDCLGLFATGVIIACARKRNFLSQDFVQSLPLNKILEKIKLPESLHFQNSLVEKFRQFSLTNPLAKNLFEKLKKIFSDEFFGMTINSFSSISLEPKLAMFCIDNKSANLNLFKKNRYFSLNVLSLEQRDLAAAFATPKNSAKWKVEPYFFSKKGNPVFYNSLAFFECKKHRVIKQGDHHIILGEILDFGKINEKEPLLYYRGKYSEIK